MDSFELFIFDFDGTIADSRVNIANSFNNALVNKGLKPLPYEDIYPTIGLLNIQLLFSKFYPNLSEEEIKDLSTLFRKYLIENAAKEISIFPKTVETLKILKNHNKLLAILTTKNHKVIKDIVKVLNLYDFFSVIYGNGLPYGNKPEKECIDYIIKKTNPQIQRSKIVMVGDTKADLIAAKNASIKSIGVSYGIEGLKIKKEGFDYVVDEFKELLKFV